MKHLQDLYQRLVLNYNDNVPFEQVEEDRFAVLNALEKQIPKKVAFTFDACLCPNCRFDMMGVYDFTNDDTKDPAYCPNCGQALDWGDCE
ncbi:MAG: hypothetical protein IKY45_04030 [Clostridia bacterium]|nr:hypothetical protein [Clostridia bacterium]